MKPLLRMGTENLLQDFCMPLCVLKGWLLWPFLVLHLSLLFKSPKTETVMLGMKAVGLKRRASVAQSSPKM